MGAMCSGSKAQPQKKSNQQELGMEDQPYLQVPSKARSMPQSKPQEEVIASKLGQEVKDLLHLNKKFNDMLNLVGNLDHLHQTTRERMNSCIILRSNISIVIQNNIKRIMREQQIIKRVEDSDQYLVYNDEKFAMTFIQQMQKLAGLILTELKNDEEFESAFPILCVSFLEIAESITSVISSSQNIKDSPLGKMGVKKQSVDSQARRTTTNRSLQQ